MIIRRVTKTRFYMKSIHNETKTKLNETDTAHNFGGETKTKRTNFVFRFVIRETFRFVIAEIQL